VLNASDVLITLLNSELLDYLEYWTLRTFIYSDRLESIVKIISGGNYKKIVFNSFVHLSIGAVA